MKIKKGDKVQVTVGKDKGKQAIIEKVFAGDKGLLPGINIFKRHLKSRGQGDSGGIKDIARPISLAKVMLICPKCSVPTRVGFRLIGKEKERFCKKCQQQIK